MSCDEFKADSSKLAPILGIAQAKNVYVYLPFCPHSNTLSVSRTSSFVLPLTVLSCSPCLRLTQGRHHSANRCLCLFLCRPRKINSVISPYGFEFKNGKIVYRDGQGQAAEEKATSHTGSNSGGNGPATEGKKEKNAKTRGKGKGKVEGKATVAKKRKLAALKSEEEDANTDADADADEDEGEDEADFEAE